MLKLEKQYRLSTPVVVIGYILLIPSVLGILFCLLMLLLTAVGGGAAVSQAGDEAAGPLRRAGVPEAVVQKTIASKPLSPREMAALTPAQRKAVMDARAGVVGTKVGAGGLAIIAGGVLIFFAIVSFVFGLLGWLLVMKKKVLRCMNCLAVVPAS
jgi:UPF0716 family protein affecting phage T7 exclusion